MATEVVSCISCRTRNRVPVVSSGLPRCGNCQLPLPWLVNAGDADFAKAIDTDLAVLVDLWAPWCKPCLMIAPTLVKMSEEFVGKLKVVKVNVDDNPNTARTYRAMSIPLVVLIKHGKVIESIKGAHPEDDYRRRLREHLWEHPNRQH